LPLKLDRGLSPYDGFEFLSSTLESLLRFGLLFDGALQAFLGFRLALGGIVQSLLGFCLNCVSRVLAEEVQENRNDKQPGGKKAPMIVGNGHQLL
jgi:hypothetical protein